MQADRTTFSMLQLRKSTLLMVCSAAVLGWSCNPIEAPQRSETQGPVQSAGVVGGASAVSANPVAGWGGTNNRNTANAAGSGSNVPGGVPAAGRAAGAGVGAASAGSPASVGRAGAASVAAAGTNGTGMVGALGCQPVMEQCDNVDNDCDGLVDEATEMPCGTSTMGICKLGKRTCVAGSWSVGCTDAVEPGVEVCDPMMLDENCDGVPNEGCDCMPGMMRDCQKQAGVCTPGTQSCVNGKWATQCDNQQRGGPEICDGIDNDCNDLVDDGSLCAIGMKCDGARKCVATCPATCPVSAEPECRPSACDQASGMCREQAAADGKACTTSDRSKGMCTRGVCQRTAPTGTIKTFIKTSGGYYLTAVDGGGVGGPDSGAGAISLHTDATSAGTFERFTLVWQDTSFTKLALKTSNGNFVTAVGGGGLLCGNSAAKCSIHTDAFATASPGTWETFSLNIASDSSVTIQTSSGRYLTATNGGGMGVAGDGDTIHTDSAGSSPGAWEVFSIQ